MIEKKITDSGAKAHQREDNENRAEIYMRWHRELSNKLLMTDVDSIEWRYRNDELVPVAIIELTRVDNDLPNPENYLQGILDRFEKRDTQATAVKKVAAALNVPAYITLFHKELNKFWVYSLTRKKVWKDFSKEEYVKFLENL